MKKILLLLTLFLAFGVSAFAATQEFKMSNIYGSATLSTLPEKQWGEFTVTADKGAGQTAPAFNKVGDVRLYAKNTITIKSSGAAITKIDFLISSQGKAQYATVTPSAGAIENQGATPSLIWNGDATEVTFTVGANNDFGTNTNKKAGQLCFSNVIITTSGEGGGDVTETVEAPVFTPAAGAVTLGTEVTIACATAGAEIYYTEDGTEPSAASIKYEGAIEIDEAKTIKAIAIKGEAKSSVVTAEYTIKAESGDQNGEATFVMADIYGTGFNAEKPWGNFKITMAKNGGSTVPTYNANGKDLRIYAKGTLTIANPDAYIVKIVFNLSAQGLKRLAPITAVPEGVATQAKGDKTVTWTGNANSVTFTVGDLAEYGSENTKNGQFAFDKVTIYLSNDEVKVVAPDFSIPSGEIEAGKSVELTCATEGAEIYYTTDGTEPTNASTKYTAPIVINEDVTIKAIAYKGADKSLVSTANYTVVKIDAVSTLAQAKTYASKATFKYTGDLTVVYVNGSNIYVYDGTEYTLIYSYDLKCKPGDVLKGGWEATVDIFNGLFELKPKTLPTVEGTAQLPAPTEITAENVATFFTPANVSAYCLFKDVEFTAATPKDKSNVTVDYNGTSVIFRNNFVLASVPAGKYDVLGFIAIHEKNAQKDMQFYPIEYTESKTDGIEGIEFDTDAPAVYYNLNGMRIDNPAEGQVVIRVQGGKASKVRF